MSNAQIGALRVDLSLATAAFTKGIGKVSSDLKGIESAANRVASNFKTMGLTMVAAVGGIATGEIAGLADQYSDLNSRVGIATGSMDTAGDTMKRLSAIASNTWSSVGNVSETFIQSNQVLKDFGKTTEDALDYTESLSNALIVSGAKGEKAASVQKALADAMVLGKLSGDGFNTVLKDGDAITLALAERLGTTVTGLRQFAAEGRITGDIIADVILTNGEKWAEQAGSMPGTFGDIATQFKNMATVVVGRFDQITGASEKFSLAAKSVFDGVQGFVNSSGFETAINGITTAVELAVIAFASIKLAPVIAQMHSFVAAIDYNTLRMQAGIVMANKYNLTMKLAEIGVKGFSSVVAALGGPIGIVTVGLGLLAMGFQRSSERARQAKETIVSLNQALKEYEEIRKTAEADPSKENVEAQKAAAQTNYNLLLEREKQIRSELATMNTQVQIGAVSVEDYDAKKAELAEIVRLRNDTNSEIDRTNNALLGVHEGEKVISAELQKQVETLREQTGNKEHQLELAGIAKQYGEDSLQYKLAELNYERDIEAAKLASLMAAVDGNAVAEETVSHAIDVQNATYDAAEAGYRFADSMSSVKAQVAGIINLLAQIGGGVMANADKFATAKLIREGKTREEAEKQTLYARQDRELAAQKQSNIDQYGNIIGAGLNAGLDFAHEGNRNADAALEAAYALDDERTSSSRGGGGGRGGGRKSRGGGGGGGRGRGSSGGGRGGMSEAEKAANKYKNTVDSLQKEILELTETQGMNGEQQEVWKAQYDAGVLGNAAQSEIIADLVAQKQQLEEQAKVLELNQQAMENMGDTFADVFSGIISGSKSSKDALRGLLDMIGNNLIKNLFSMLGGTGTAGASWATWLFGSIGQNANGTSGWRGGLTWVGERGPELVNLNKGAKVFSNKESMNMMGSGGASTVHISLSEGLEASILDQAKNQSIQISTMASERLRKSLPSEMRKVSADSRRT